MSRRSARLKTSGYYPQDDDTASTCSNGSASPISYKESPFRCVGAAVWRRSPVFQASPPLATEPAGFSSGYSSSEDGDYPQSSECVSRAFALLYWWLGPAWYSLTSGISLLDVFLLSASMTGVLFFTGAWYWYPFVTAQLLHTAEKTMIDPTHLHTRAPLYVSTFFVNFDQEVVMRPDLERELEALEKKIIDRLRQQQDKEKRDVWRVVGETLQEEGMGAVAIKHIVHRALSLFRADGTGMADYALESSGASVINTRCSETYRTRSACLSLFGIPLWYHSENPRAVIQPEVYPGKCWAFRGSEGFLVISLSYPVRITHITLEHIPRNLSPTGHIDSAPKDFTVYGMTHEHEEGKLLGSFTYDQDGEPIQTYQVPESPSEVYHLVELRVLSNWGHPEYTCLYRFRVHGLPWSTSQEERRTRESINE
uniref:SUN domain-containing protein n=1 Tax=Electrophorus electricus TaxID=8005 RepID=A0AAY5EMA3_ELEEL